MNTEAEYRYADIINLPHHVSKQHVPMSMGDRAAQFSPFAALTGHDAAIADVVNTGVAVKDSDVLKCSALCVSSDNACSCNLTVG